MTYLSLIDKIKILFITLFDFKGILIFSIFMIALTVVYLTKRISSKRYTIGIVLSLILLFLISILTNLKIFNDTFDNFMTIFFNGIYFPSIYIYISTLIIVLLSFIVSTSNIKTKKVYKIINKIMFVLNNVLFVIILNIVAKNRIDVFSVNSLYTDTNLVAMLEVSMGLFLIWIASLVVAYATNCICDRLAKKKEVVEDVSLVEVPHKEELLESTLTEMTYNDVKVVEESTVCEESIKEDIVKEEVKASNEMDSLYILPVEATTKIDNNDGYKLVNPQEIYERDYNMLKEKANQSLTNNLVINNIDVLDVKEAVSPIEKESKSDETILENDSISLNDLANEVVQKEELPIYTLEDYKKVISMLNSLKIHSRNHNITVDDAVAISLISNYSIDDCLKLKDILESTLN